MPLVPGTNIISIEVKLYDPEMMMSDPTALPPAGGHTVLLLVHELKGLQVTLPALDVNVTLRAEAGIPANPEMVVVIWPTVIAQPVPAHPAPWVAAARVAALTACARL
ncbi:MAG: hypothetical protein ABSF54_11645 [Bryobacteraceae bacterium]